MIFVTFNYLTPPDQDGVQQVKGAYFGASDTVKGIMEILQGAMQPGMVMSDVRLFGQAVEPSLFARAKARRDAWLNQRRERREAKEREWFESNFTEAERDKMSKGFVKLSELFSGRKQ